LFFAFKKSKTKNKHRVFFFFFSSSLKNKNIFPEIYLFLPAVPLSHRRRLSLQPSVSLSLSLSLSLSILEPNRKEAFLRWIALLFWFFSVGASARERSLLEAAEQKQKSLAERVRRGGKRKKKEKQKRTRSRGSLHA
jgi:hypothetical protein